MYKRNCIIDEKARELESDPGSLAGPWPGKIETEAQGAPLGDSNSSQLLIRIPQERKELISKAYFDVGGLKPE